MLICLEKDMTIFMRKRIKKTIKSIYKCYAERCRSKIDSKIIGEYIANSKESIPELTKQQKCDIRNFWGKYGIEIPMDWHRLIYAKTGNYDPSYVPEPIFHRIIKPRMNNYTFAGVWSDKAYIDYFIRDVKTVRTVVRNVDGRFLDENFHLVSGEEAQRIMQQYDNLVIKPSIYTETGKGVMLLHKPFDLYVLSKKYKNNYVIQIPLKQHVELAKLNESSVNTIRINSVLFDRKAHIMSSFMKVGQAGEFADNKGKDRFFIGINEDGTLNNYAINHDLQKFGSIPSGYAFAGQRVPCFDSVCTAIEKAHECIPHFGFAFWDVCVTEDGDPNIVEVNLRYPDTIIPQVAGKPFMGKYTEDIIKYILPKSK